MSLIHVHIGRGDFLWIFLCGFILFSFESIAPLFCVEFCATEFVFFFILVIYGVI